MQLILDIDGAPDSAAAVLLAAALPDTELAAVCSVFGQTAAAAVTAASARTILADISPRTVIYAGCESPLSRRLFDEAQAKGSTIRDDGDHAAALHWGLAGAAGTHRENTWPAALFYAEYLCDLEQPVTIVATGPLTNLAMALVLEPKLAAGIERVIVAGGGDLATDHTGAAETAVWLDPEAAQRVINSGIDVLFVPLDAAAAAALAPSEIPAFPAGSLTADRVWQFAVGHCPQTPDGQILLHGPLALSALWQPQVLSDIQRVHCEIGYYDCSRGQTMIDRRMREQPPANVSFACSGEKAVFASVLTQLVGRWNRV